MAIASVTYYHGETPLHTVTSMLKKDVLLKFPDQKRFVKYDGYSVMIGWVEGKDIFKDKGDYLAATRKIFFKKNPSLHKCDARCQNAKGHDCECSCGGANHGKNA